MPSLLSVVFALQLFIHVVNTVGANTINQLLWILYNKLPTPTSKAANEQTRLKREVVRIKRELNAISAQDNFSKWAKIRRQHDKVLADYEKTDASLRASQTSFNTTITTIRWVSTNGLRFVLQFWCAKQPMFWIPQGWMPGYVEWLLSFPRAPRGSVSINVWGIACASMVALVSEAITAVYVLVTKKSPEQMREKPQAFAADGAKGEAGRKKEL